MSTDNMDMHSDFIDFLKSKIKNCYTLFVQDLYIYYHDSLILSKVALKIAYARR